MWTFALTQSINSASTATTVVACFASKNKSVQYSLIILCHITSIVPAFTSITRPNTPVVRNGLLFFIFKSLFLSLAGWAQCFLTAVYILHSRIAVLPYLGYIRHQTASFGLLEVFNDPNYILFSVFPLAISYLPEAPVSEQWLTVFDIISSFLSFVGFLFSVVLHRNSSQHRAGTQSRPVYQRTTFS